MKFVKMQGAGNDFVVVEPAKTDRDWPKLAVAICDRRHGVGGDGLLLVVPSQTADFRMRMFNPDGSESEACGNGLRCVVKYVADRRPELAGREISVETQAGQRKAWVSVHEGVVRSVEVTMGAPRFAPADIPVRLPAHEVDIKMVIDYPLQVAGRELKVTCVSMGNPHAVCFLDMPVDDFPLSVIGPQVEKHAMFPKRTNFEIVNVVDKGRLKVKVWERGAGETLACGTGACAVAVAGQLKKLVGRKVELALPGGRLGVVWDGVGEVRLSGPAAQVFAGEWPV
ncbi:MAG: diaminopimelate epimerase [Dehalococcoidia bacterium]|nr:diaminopimelate epimerase [Dehalococcoidia bacterium]